MSAQRPDLIMSAVVLIGGGVFAIALGIRILMDMRGCS